MHQLTTDQKGASFTTERERTQFGYLTVIIGSFSCSWLVISFLQCTSYFLRNTFIHFHSVLLLLVFLFDLFSCLALMFFFSVLRFFQIEGHEPKTLRQSPCSYVSCACGLTGCFRGGGGILLDFGITAPHLTLVCLKVNSVCKSLFPVTNPQEHIRHTTIDPTGLKSGSTNC